ncbi:MAG: glucose PTS transporter subunit IIA [Micropruina sp.]|uniref:glucose PTS transporter subunit IIA n=1 Tax=Micropruina sp. TaxID=2737536 RepID=UPI0039E2FA41
MRYSEVAERVIAAVGGVGNVSNAWHCMTRLRFDLKDAGKADLAALEAIPEVIGTNVQNGELQVVVGTEVEKYYEQLADQLGLADKAGDADGSGAKRGWVALAMDTVSGVFGPIVPAIAGAGMIKGLMAGLAALGVISNKNDTYLVIDMIASGVFTFLPFFVAASAAKIFKTNMFMAVAIAAAMQYPTMTAAAAAKEISAFMLFGIVPVPVFNYAGTVIPIIFSVFALSHIYRWVDRVLPRVLRTVFTPTFSLFIAGALALTVIGPIGIFLGNQLAAGVAWLFATSPILAGIIFGATRPIAVFTGLHHAETPIALQNFANRGWDNLMPMMFMANMAIAGATAAIYFKVRNKDQKTVVASAAVSGLLGITEPALFGVLAKYRRAFVAATIGSAIASTFFAVFGVRIYAYILSSIFSLPAYVGPYFPFALAGIAIAISTSFVLTLLLVPAEPAADATPVAEAAPQGSGGAKGDQVELVAVARGAFVPLEQVSDAVFASKTVGDGYALQPADGDVYAPVSGTVTVVFPTKHAIGLKTDDGVEVLVHLGIDTVSLKGEGFEVFCAPGDRVNPSTRIARVDLDSVRRAGKDPVILVLVTNLGKVSTVNEFDGADAALQRGDSVVSVSAAV